MARVKIIQTHRATVVQTDTYEIDDESTIRYLAILPETDRESFVEDNGVQVASGTEIQEIHETIGVEVTW